MTLDESLNVLRARIQATRERLEKAHDRVRPAIEGLERAMADVASSWSRSAAGYHGFLYFGDFETPGTMEQFSVEWGGLRGIPDGWRERSGAEVRDAVQARAGVKIEKVERAAAAIGPEVVALQDDIGVQLAPIRQLPVLTTEVARLDALEAMKLRVKVHEYVSDNMPRRAMTRDSEALMQGLAVPHHIIYRGQLAEAASVFTKGAEFLQAADRLVRQLIVQRQAMEQEPTEPEALARVVRICERFPIAVLQAQKRQRSREPIAMDDEYDVQDFLQTLLRVDFDDVRPEERTPSHAGSSPAMDFLLKVEQIVIEAKMARESMTAKDLGDELLADIGRYRAHPDCRTLVCFVYDPEGRLPNPRGLERDLMKLSSDDLRVIVIIVPRR